ncbi:hypothetical protein EJ02DRAFT_423358 [Clathrospora elynae]|uniref:Uncharacterized protein n=1 Tax=Clathrospora elynae TaxID=706981 RepID=A0A6A5SNC0_9PLEO|nr:hypothetical protein EJ02DRAFT_423358 [Clathrospora elynae]
MMLKPHLEERCNAQRLFETIHEATQDPDTQLPFMGLCCTEQEDTAESLQSSVFDPELIGFLTEATTESSAVSEAIHKLHKSSEPAHGLTERVSLNVIPVASPANDTVTAKGALELPSIEQTDIPGTRDSNIGHLTEPALRSIENLNGRLGTNPVIARIQGTPSNDTITSAYGPAKGPDHKVSGLKMFDPESTGRNLNAHNVLKQGSSDNADLGAIATPGLFQQHEWSQTNVLMPQLNTSKLALRGYHASRGSDQVSIHVQHEEESLRLPRELLSQWTIPGDARNAYN